MSDDALARALHRLGRALLPTEADRRRMLADFERRLALLERGGAQDRAADQSSR